MVLCPPHRGCHRVHFWREGASGGPLVQTTPGFWILWFLWCMVFGLFFTLISKTSLCGFCKGPLLAHRVPPVIEGRRDCSSFPSLPSSALSLMGTAAGGVTCCVAEGHRRCDPPSRGWGGTEMGLRSTPITTYTHTHN